MANATKTNGIEKNIGRKSQRPNTLAYVRENNDEHMPTMGEWKYGCYSIPVLSSKCDHDVFPNCDHIKVFS